MVIVTKRCFIYAEEIRYITIHEDRDFEAEEKNSIFSSIRRTSRSKKLSRKGSKNISRPITKYTILVYYVANKQQAIADTCEVYTYDKKVAETMFANMVQQYREQNPDAVYLDKIAEQFLSDIQGDK